MAAAARVLVVDDEPVFLRGVVTMLIRQGYDALSASGPNQALDLVRWHRPIDVVVSDANMPQMQGTDLISEVAQISPETACILMTGGMANSVELPPLVPLLRKPFARLDLVAAVEKAIERSAKLRSELRESMERGRELQQEARRLKSESQEVVRKSAQTRFESRLRRERRDRSWNI